MNGVAASGGAIPVVLLTGFLGAGKTTTVNHLLGGDHGLRLAVLVNEFGALGIDGKLLAQSGAPVVELANGCICCATGGELLRSLNALLEQDRTLDGILIETSGLADPAPVADSLERVRFVRDLRLSGVVTIVDALNYDDSLDQALAAYQQLVAADLVLINKTDLVPAEIPGLIEHSIARLNPSARTLRCAGGRVPHQLILDLVHRPGSASAAPAGHDHNGGFESVVLTANAPLLPERFDIWLDRLPRSIVRAKGFVRFDGQSRPLAFHLVGRRRAVEPFVHDVAGAELVLIGRDLVPDQLQAALEGCMR